MLWKLGDYELLRRHRDDGDNYDAAAVAAP